MAARLPRTRSGRLPAVPLPRVRNPATGRLIIVNGPTHRLIRQHRVARLTIAEDDTSVVLTIRPGTILHVRFIFHPSDHVELVPRPYDHRLNAIGRAALQDALVNNTEVDYELLTSGMDAFFQDLAAVMYVGPYGIIRDNYEMLVADIDNPFWGLAEDIYCDYPPSLPIANALTNEGPDNRCLARALMAHPVVASFLNLGNDSFGLGVDWKEEIENMDPRLPSITDFIQRHRLPIDVEVSDVWGSIVYRSTADKSTALGTMVNIPFKAIIYAGHVYPMKYPTLLALFHDGERIKFNAPWEFVDEPVHQYQNAHELRRHCVETGRALISVGNTYYLGDAPTWVPRAWNPLPAGVYKPIEESASHFEPWMERWRMCIPRFSMSPDVLHVIKKTLLSLYSIDPAVAGTTSTSDYWCIDMTKCYYNALRDLILKDQLAAPDVFSTCWEPASNLDLWDTFPGRQTIYLWEAIDWDPACLGIRTNLAEREMLVLLHREKFVFNITYACHFFNGHRQIVYDPLLSEIRADIIPPDQKKKYAILNGMFGRLGRVETTMMSAIGCSTDERAYYREAYGFSDVGEVMLLQQEDHTPEHRYHIHMQVILHANTMVLQKHFDVQSRRLGTRLVRVCTDSLTYTNPPTLSGFVGGHVVAAGDLWHFEQVRLPRSGRKFQFRRGETYFRPPTFSRNITFIGPPGTGKTTQALALRHDIAACYCHKGARRLGPDAVTVHWLLGGMNPFNKNISFERIRGKTVLIDEAECLSRKIWNLLMVAYRDYKTSFIFSMDPDQLPPVNEPPVPFRHPFYGMIRELTKDLRNNPQVVHWRTLIKSSAGALTRLWESGVVTTITGTDPPYTDINIAPTNPEIDEVNRLITLRRGLKFGDPGPYIALRTSHAPNSSTDNLGPPVKISRSEIWMREDSDRMTRVTVDGEVVTCVVPPNRLASLFKWAWCTTIHKRIGETLTERYTIWGWKRICDREKRELGVGEARHMAYTAISRCRSLDQIVLRAAAHP